MAKEKMVMTLEWKPMAIKDLTPGSVVKVDRPDGGADIYMASTGAIDDGEVISVELEKVCIVKDMLIEKAVIKTTKESNIVKPTGGDPIVKVQ